MCVYHVLHRAVRQVRKELVHHTDCVSTVIWWRRTGREPLLVSFASDGNVIVWDLDADCPALVQKLHTAPINDARVCPTKENRVATAALDGSVSVWDYIQVSFGECCGSVCA